MVSNLFGTPKRTRFLFRDTLRAVRHLVELKIDAGTFWKNPWRYRDVPGTLLHMLPKARQDRPDPGPGNDHSANCRSCGVGRETAARSSRCRRSTPKTRTGPAGGTRTSACIACSFPATVRTGSRSRAALSDSSRHRRASRGGDAARRAAARQHLRRRPAGDDAGRRHAAAGRAAGAGVRRRSGRPAHCAGLPSASRQRQGQGDEGSHRSLLLVSCLVPSADPAEADFCITGTVDPQRLLPEGPFGDHLGYYSLAHDFPVLHVERVYHRPGAIWPFTVVGRPPQEDTCFGDLIHELTGPDHSDRGARRARGPCRRCGRRASAAAGHRQRTLCALCRARRPQELLTCANALLGQGQLSLAKYLLIVAHEDDPELDIHDIAAFFRHLLERVDWTTDLHFQTRTTIDTLDYSGSGLNEGSKVVIAAAGGKRRGLGVELPANLHLPEGFSEPRVCLPGVLAVEAPKYPGRPRGRDAAGRAEILSGIGRRRSDHGFPADRAGGRQRFHGPLPEQFVVGDVHALEPGRRHPRRRSIYRSTNTGAAPGRW